MDGGAAPCDSSKTNCNYDKIVVPSGVKFSELKPTLVWRGGNYDFVHTQPEGMNAVTSMRTVRAAVNVLEKRKTPVTAQNIMHVLKTAGKLHLVTPRLRAVLMSEAVGAAQREASESEKKSNKNMNKGDVVPELPPLMDMKFLATAEELDDGSEQHKTSKELYEHLGKHGITAHTERRMTVLELAKYKYHIDLGGAGGTTWSGLLAKLGMPGLLFHHETTMTEFFMDNEVKPWVHFVPVKMDLTDLPERLKWAETHPAEAERIARAGTDFVVNLRQPKMVEHLLNKYVRNQTNEVINNYRHSAGGLSILESYIAAGVSRDRLVVRSVEHLDRQMRENPSAVPDADDVSPDDASSSSKPAAQPEAFVEKAAAAAAAAEEAKAAEAKAAAAAAAAEEAAGVPAPSAAAAAAAAKAAATAAKESAERENANAAVLEARAEAAAMEKKAEEAEAAAADAKRAAAEEVAAAAAARAEADALKAASEQAAAEAAKTSAIAQAKAAAKALADADAQAVAAAKAKKAMDKADAEREKKAKDEAAALAAADAADAADAKKSKSSSSSSSSSKGEHKKVGLDSIDDKKAGKKKEVWRGKGDEDGEETSKHLSRHGGRGSSKGGSLGGGDKNSGDDEKHHHSSSSEKEKESSSSKSKKESSKSSSSTKGKSSS